MNIISADQASYESWLDSQRDDYTKPKEDSIMQDWLQQQLPLNALMVLKEVNKRAYEIARNYDHSYSMTISKIEGVWAVWQNDCTIGEFVLALINLMENQVRVSTENLSEPIRQAKLTPNAVRLTSNLEYLLRARGLMPV